MGKLSVPTHPGFLKNGTQYQAKARWYDGNWVRFSEGSLRPLGGWTKVTQLKQVVTVTIASPGVVSLTNTFLAGQKVTLSTTGALPTGLVAGTVYFVISAGLTGSAFQLSLTAGGAAINTSGSQSGVHSLTLAPLAGTPRALFTWFSDAPQRYLAAATNSNLYVSLDSRTWYDVTPAGFTAGGVDAIESAGYGGFTYGSSNYGTQRPTTNSIQPATWMLDNWGQDLVGCSRADGKLYQWTRTLASSAAIIANAPTLNSGVIVSDQRHLIALGAGGNQRSVKWSDKENNTQWTPLATNEAGGFEFTTNGAIVGAVRVTKQVLVLTTVDAHAMTYVGQPYVYGRDKVGEACGIKGPGALIATVSFAAWMSDKRFWIYDGAAVRPLPCDVADYVFLDLNATQGAKITGAHNGTFGELTWYYPSSNSQENNRYVTWNYRENSWVTGTLSRTAWTDKGAYSNPFGANAAGDVYRHEDGFLDDGATRVGNVWAETGALELGSGDNTFDVTQLLPDEKTSGSVIFKFRTRFAPNGPEYSYGPYAVNTDGMSDARFSGRQAIMRVEAAADATFQVGTPRLEAIATGRR